MQKLIEELNDKQKEAVLTTEGPCLVIAGAGSRKNKSIDTQNSIFNIRKENKTIQYISNYIYQ